MNPNHLWPEVSGVPQLERCWVLQFSQKCRIMVDDVDLRCNQLDISLKWSRDVPEPVRNAGFQGFPGA